MFEFSRQEMFLSPEVLRAIHDHRTAELQKHFRADEVQFDHKEHAAHRQFLVMYQVRSWFFRLAPRWAARLVL